MNKTNFYKETKIECFTLAELSRRGNIEFVLLAKLIEHKVIIADGPSANLYSTAQLFRLQRLQGLMNDIELEGSTATLALFLLGRIESLEKRCSWLQLTVLDAQKSTKH